jgi:hypothetical protein
MVMEVKLNIILLNFTLKCKELTAGIRLGKPDGQFLMC